MLHPYGGDLDHGADINHHDEEECGRSKLYPPLQLPKNRSTGNLELAKDNPERARIRFSFDAGAAAADCDGITRSPLMTDHDHGLGLSGLRRIRQNLSRTPTIPSQPASRSPSLGLSRSSSVTMMLDPHSHTMPLSPGPASPVFTEDLSRFPSESLHSFSFAHQSEELIHNRQDLLKRSVEFMRDRLGWTAGQNLAIASAQSQASGDAEIQGVLDMLSRAQITGAGVLPDPNSSTPQAPLSGPPDMSGQNVFDKEFIPRTASPELLNAMSPLSPSTSRHVPILGNGPLDASQSDENAPGKLLSPLSPVTTSDYVPWDAAAQSSPLSQRPASLKRALTDTANVSMQQKLMDTMANSFVEGHSLQPQFSPPTPTPSQSFPSSLNGSAALSSAVHGHSTRWVPAAQAIFTTKAKPPYTVLAANDLACLVFGVTKAEVRRMGIMEVVQEERRAWLEKKLQGGHSDHTGDGSEGDVARPTHAVQTSKLLGARAGGITSKLLSKPNSRSISASRLAAERRAATVHSGDARPPKMSHHNNNKSRGVLLCGEVVPIRKRNGATGSASLWVKEKRFGLIWVLEEIHEDIAYITLGEDGLVTRVSGAMGPIWGEEAIQPGIDVGRLVPRVPRQGIDPRYGEIDYAQIARRQYFTCRNSGRINIPATVEQVRGKTELRVSSFPHIAGIVVVNTNGLTIKSSNSAFCGALFGYESPDGLSINSLIPDFDKVLRILMEEDGVNLTDGIVIPEHSFRKAFGFLALREGKSDATTNFLRPDGLPARHRDGSELKIDVQMRVVQSEKQTVLQDETAIGSNEDGSTPAEQGDGFTVTTSELVYALWITYSRHLHATRNNLGAASPLLSGTATPLHQPSPGQTTAHTPQEMSSDSEETKKELSAVSLLTKHLKEVAMTAAVRITGSPRPEKSQPTPAARRPLPPLPPLLPPLPPSTVEKKAIEDFVILEEMGQGAYGQVKLARYKNNTQRCVLKYVTKRRILVDTWTRDRKLGTVPLEIHVLDYLRKDGLRHPNIVEMEDFFEDNINYYIEMVPHGLPGMDLFDYIELRTNMDEQECRSIFVQVVRAIHHLHTKAQVVHRDIKDENVILDGEGNIKLIDFGSAAYIKSGPFDVFVGTIDYAAPEVLAGKPYRGREQDVWALGILLYTIIYKENPFYSIDEIMDRDLRVPYTISDESIDLVRHMLDRDVSQRYDIEQVLAHPWCEMDE